MRNNCFFSSCGSRFFGNLDHLHPEYEVYDWNRKSQFLDFAYLPAFGRFGNECDGYQSHIKDMDREGFNYSLNRETRLIIEQLSNGSMLWWRKDVSVQSLMESILVTMK